MAEDGHQRLSKRFGGLRPPAETSVFFTGQVNEKSLLNRAERRRQGPRAFTSSQSFHKPAAGSVMAFSTPIVGSSRRTSRARDGPHLSGRKTLRRPMTVLDTCD